MKSLIILACLVAAACAVKLDDIQLKAHWQNFKTTHGKKYESQEVEAFRMKIFKENVNRITKHNARYQKGEVSFKLGVNKYSDMHAHEVSEMLNGFRMELAKSPSGRVHMKDPAENNTKLAVDWRAEGYVTDVKDQGQCGSCWSFSATGSLEGALFKKTGNLVSLSEQNLVDCSSTRRYGNEGCNGGLMTSAFKYVIANQGIDTEQSYPYKGYKRWWCHYKKQKNAGFCTDYTDVNPTEEDLQDAVEKVGPVSIAIDASQASFQSYAGGVYVEPYCSSQNLDHGVLAVGYGTDPMHGDYWIVKNSWGASWGEEGFIRMARNKGNQCGVATMASYPIV